MLLDRKKCLFQIRQLCSKNVKIICLIGMDGIDKTIIEKTIFIDIKHMYDTSCFIKIAQNSGNSYSISCNILQQLKVEKKTKRFKESIRNIKIILY